MVLWFYKEEICVGAMLCRQSLLPGADVWGWRLEARGGESRDVLAGAASGAAVLQPSSEGLSRKGADGAGAPASLAL